MDGNDLRLECLKLALARGGSATDVINFARQMVDFVSQKSDAPIIEKARELAALL